MAWDFEDANPGGVSLADNTALTLPAGDWSLGGLVKLESNAGSDHQYFLSWGVHSANPSINFFFTETGEGSANADELRVWIEDANADTYSINTTSEPGTSTLWQYLMLIHSGDFLYLYVNDVQVGSDENANVGEINLGDNLFLGIRLDDDADRRLDGSMAEWAKWDRALDAGERAALVAGYAPSFFPNSLKWYVPMLRTYTERIVPIAVTNTDSTVVSHPRIIYPKGLLVPVGTAAAPPVGAAGIMTTNTGFWGPTF